MLRPLRGLDRALVGGTDDFDDTPLKGLVGLPLAGRDDGAPLTGRLPTVWRLRADAERWGGFALFAPVYVTLVSSAPAVDPCGASIVMNILQPDSDRE